MTEIPQRQGGLARAKNLDPERRAAIGKMGADARWGASDVPRALDEGVLKIGDGIRIPCAVLDTKQRVLTQSGVMRALGRARQAKGRQHYQGDVNLPAFLTAQNLKPYIPNELYVTSSQIEFRTKTGGKAFGYPAELLSKVCRVFVKADAAKVLTKMQKPIATQARLLLEGLEDVAIIALIDEATGYQEKRAKDELQTILAAYISPSLLPWTEKFPQDFFQEMFRVFWLALADGTRLCLPGPHWTEVCRQADKANHLWEPAAWRFDRTREAEPCRSKVAAKNPDDPAYDRKHGASSRRKAGGQHHSAFSAL